MLDKLRLSFPELSFEIEVIKTQGDSPSSQFSSENQGLFTKEIELALERGSIDLAVHSAKDLPTALLPSLEINSILERDDVRDAWISAKGEPWSKLEKGARVATGSPRRKAQLLKIRPDLEMVEIRGNVPTRIKKMREGLCDGLILAGCGLLRLGMQSEITELLDKEIMMPAVSQGAIAVEARKSDQDTELFKKVINHEPSFLRIEAERSFLSGLRGGCQVPAGAWSAVEGDIIHLEGAIFSLDGTRSVSGKISGVKTKAAHAGFTLAEQLKSRGGLEILGQIRK